MVVYVIGWWLKEMLCIVNGDWYVLKLVLIFFEVEDMLLGDRVYDGLCMWVIRLFSEVKEIVRLVGRLNY